MTSITMFLNADEIAYLIASLKATQSSIENISRLEESTINELTIKLQKAKTKLDNFSFQDYF